MGGFEPVAKPWAMDGIPENFEFGMLPDDWDQFQILMENALIRLPALETAEIKTFMNGPESFTPDNNFIMGEAPELKNFYRRGGLQLDRHRVRRRGRARARRMDRAGRADARSLAGRYPPLRALPRQRPLPEGARQRGARPALHDAVAEPRTAVGAAAAPLAALRPARRAERAVRLQDGLGAAELLCAQQGRGADRLCVGAAELVSLRGGRAQGDARGGDDHRPHLVLEVPAAGARRGKRAAAALRQRCRGAASARRSIPGCSTRAAPTRAI